VAISPSRPDTATVLAFAGIVLFGGLNTISVRQTVLELDPLWGAALRLFAAGAICVVLTVARGRSFPQGRSFSGAMLYGAIGFGAAFSLLYPALREVQAGTASVVISLSPLMTYILAVGQGQERFRAQGLVGSLIALAGIVIIFLDQLSAAAPLGSLGLIALAVLAMSEAGIIVKWIPRSDPFGTNAIAMLTGGVILFAASFLQGETVALPTATVTWLAFGYVTVFGSVVMFGLYLFGIRRWTASGMSYTTLLLPFVSVTAARLLTGEQFSAAFVAGGLVMLAGVYIGAFATWRPARSTATSLPECLPIADCAEPVSSAPGRPA
jgi:drug/metabolite transporter (DMT)-like permease